MNLPDVFAPLERAQVAPHPPRDRQYSDNSNDKVESMKEGLERRIRVPLFAQLLTDVRQSQAPGQRSGEGINHKALEIHSRHARGKCDEGPNDRQQTAGEDNDFAETREPAIGKIEIVM